MSDPIIEAAARALQSASAWTIGTNMARSYVETIISYTKPGIEAAALERAGQAAMDCDVSQCDAYMARRDIAVAIRALITGNGN